jgi:hypothetical protein
MPRGVPQLLIVISGALLVITICSPAAAARPATNEKWTLP